MSTVKVYRLLILLLYLLHLLFLLKYFKVNHRHQWIKIYTQTHTHTYTHTMEYYSAIKKNETLPFAATWMDLEIVILSEVPDRERQISYDLYVESKKNDTNELKRKTEIDPQT